MSGHNKWTQIKHQKGAADEKRARLFSKTLNAISVIAKNDPNPNTNQKLKSAIQKAKEANIPLDNINRAINRTKDSGNNFEELFLEAYGPGGVAILIESVSDNRNRTVAEIKKIISDCNGRWGEPGSVRWIFQKSSTEPDSAWTAKFSHPVDETTGVEIEKLISRLKDHADVHEVFSNVQFKQKNP